jgi:hypothetical protein
MAVRLDGISSALLCAGLFPDLWHAARRNRTLEQPCGLDSGRSLCAIDADCARRAGADPVKPRPYGEPILGIGPAFEHATIPRHRDGWHRRSPRTNAKRSSPRTRRCRRSDSLYCFRPWLRERCADRAMTLIRY